MNRVSIVKAQMRRDALRHYLVYQIKSIELLHLHLLWKAVRLGYAPPNRLSHDSKLFEDTLRTAITGWFAVLVDQSKDGMNVFDLWKELFPKHQKAIDRIWQKIQPDWNLIRSFRDNAAFHASKPKKYFDAQQKFVAESSRIIKVLDSFVSLQACLSRRLDRELPDFVPEIESLLLDIELQTEGFSLQREWFKQRGLLPRGNFRKIY